jgi:YfiH family protein
MRFDSADWPGPPGVHAGQTLREGGFSAAPYDSLNLGDHCGDAPDRVARNRALLRESLGLPGEPAWLRQVHGTTVVAAHEVTGPPPAADGSWTDRPGVVCAVLTADCLPVLLASDDGRVMAAAHAGWRGLVAGVLEATVAAMPAAPTELRAWFGAAIGPRAFEVGPEVRDAFVANDPAAATAFQRGAGDRWYGDLYALARARLARAGVTRVHGGVHCTFDESARYYSFRRDARCGRMAALIWRDPC